MPMQDKDAALLPTLAVRERYRDKYWRKRDPIAEDRLLWRAQTLRHTVHLLPGQTILELGSGEGLFTRALGTPLIEWGVPLPRDTAIRFPRPEAVEEMERELAELFLRGMGALKAASQET